MLRLNCFSKLNNFDQASRGVSLAGRGTHTFLGICGLRQRATANNPALSTVIIPPSGK
jgi:hypothetical protein